MSSQPSVLSRTRTLLLLDWQSSDPLQSPGAQDCCDPPSDMLLQSLVDLVRSCVHTPTDELRPMIRRLMLEHSFADECGDPAGMQNTRRTFEHNLNVLVQTLEQVKQDALARGEWSQDNDPAVVPMFG